MKKILISKNLIGCLTALLTFNIHPFKITSLQKVLEQHPEITYQKIYDELSIEIPPLEIAQSYPHKATFKELFILTIPNGIVRGIHGYILVDNGFIEELIWGGVINLMQIPAHVQNINTENILKIPGKVAVISQLDTKNYLHWLYEILGRFAILEMNNIEYDWLYVSIEEQPFVKKIAELWGMDTSKVISPHDHYFAIEAEELIVPSFVIRTNVGHKQFANFYHPLTLTYTRDKLLHKALEKNIDPSQFSKKVFISRGDGINPRKIANENEVFKLFEAKGFKSYVLTKLSIAEQIILFHNAEIIVGENGAGLTNFIFCKPRTTVIEIFQNFVSMDYWYAASLYNLKYIPINTLLGEDANFYSDWHKDLHKFYSYPTHPVIPLDKIKELIRELP